MQESKLKYFNDVILHNTKFTLNHSKILKRNFYARDTSTIARELLGKFIVKKVNGLICGGMIIETEAYYGLQDPASHAFRGITPRSILMFQKPGVAYVYFCYGMYYLFNVVTEKDGVPGAVLIRGLQPVFGIEDMVARRKTGSVPNLENGPGKLTIALDIGIKDNGKDITKIDGDIGIFNMEINLNDFEIIASQRIGITNGKDKLLRYYLKLI
jgi:DNA-3-methyladenine glycosylase